jgi:hypothetical protein
MQAIEDIVIENPVGAYNYYYKGERRKGGASIRKDARNWILSDYQNGEGSFLWVCAELDLIDMIPKIRALIQDREWCLKIRKMIIRREDGFSHTNNQVGQKKRARKDSRPNPSGD